jgi:hypothetical protein
MVSTTGTGATAGTLGNSTGAQSVNNGMVKTPSSTVPAGQPTIVGTVTGTGGKTYYIASNGYIYYRADNGSLEIFGRGVPE